MAKSHPTETFEKLLTRIRNHRNNQIYLTLTTCQMLRGCIPDDYRILLCSDGFNIKRKNCSRLDIVLQYDVEDEVSGVLTIYEFPENGKVRLY